MTKLVCVNESKYGYDQSWGQCMMCTCLHHKTDIATGSHASCSSNIASYLAIAISHAYAAKITLAEWFILYVYVIATSYVWNSHWAVTYMYACVVSSVISITV